MLHSTTLNTTVEYKYLTNICTHSLGAYLVGKLMLCKLRGHLQNDITVWFILLYFDKITALQDLNHSWFKNTKTIKQKSLDFINLGILSSLEVTFRMISPTFYFYLFLLHYCALKNYHDNSNVVQIQSNSTATICYIFQSIS